MSKKKKTKKQIKKQVRRELAAIIHYTLKHPGEAFENHVFETIPKIAKVLRKYL